MPTNTQQSRNTAAFARLVAALNAVHTLANIVAVHLGNKANLATADKSSVVAAINEVKAALDAIPPAAAINDQVTGVATVWSSSKTQAQITAAVTGLINGAPGAQDSIGELAAQVTALVQADQGLVSTSAVQNFSPAQQKQACENLGLGDPDHDFVPGIEALLNAGL